MRWPSISSARAGSVRVRSCALAPLADAPRDGARDRVDVLQVGAVVDHEPVHPGTAAVPGWTGSWSTTAPTWRTSTRSRAPSRGASASGARAQLLTRTDPARADEMLGHLITYLRHSLPRAEEAFATLGEEVERARAYL